MAKRNVAGSGETAVTHAFAIGTSGAPKADELRLGAGDVDTRHLDARAWRWVGGLAGVRHRG